MRSAAATFFSYRFFIDLLLLLLSAKVLPKLLDFYRQIFMLNFYYKK